MRYYCLVLFLSFSVPVLAQTYDAQMDKAGSLLQEKKFSEALIVFRSALADTLRTGPFDLYYGALAAVKCHEDSLALRWLQMGSKKGLGNSDKDFGVLQQDTNFAVLHPYPGWQAFIALLQQAADKRAEADRRFKLYFSKADTIDVPYLVYVPAGYDPRLAAPALVYLHGGVVGMDHFDDKNPDVKQEPIFAVADSLHLIVVYPFGRKDFGWVDQPAAFRQVLHILDEVIRRYRVDIHRLYMAGMSNGGSACFWFASQSSTPFRSFLALSPMPRLNIGKIDFAAITTHRPMYTLNAKDDEVFPYVGVSRIYQEEGAKAKGWRFGTLESGGHGFLYGSTGMPLLYEYLHKMMQ